MPLCVFQEHTNKVLSCRYQAITMKKTSVSKADFIGNLAARASERHCLTIHCPSAMRLKSLQIAGGAHKLPLRNWFIDNQGRAIFP
jgi:hypothetical protein